MPRGTRKLKVIPDILPFNPAEVDYWHKYTRNGQVTKKGEKLYGPYWYAYWMERQSVGKWKIHTYYLGKELPEQCKPYAKDVKVNIPEANTRFMLKPLVGHMKEGDQLIIRVQEIANECGGYYKSLGNDEYLIYK